MTIPDAISREHTGCSRRIFVFKVMLCLRFFSLFLSCRSLFLLFSDGQNWTAPDSTITQTEKGGKVIEVH